MNDIGMPPDSVAGLDDRDRHIGPQQLGVIGATDGQGARRRGAAKLVFGNIVLKRAQYDPPHGVGDRHEIQRAVARPLAAQRRPSLIGAEHRAYRRRGNFLCNRAECSIKRFVGPDIARQKMPIDLPISGVEPALHRTAVHMRAETERVVSRLTLAQPVGIKAFAIRIEFDTVFRVEIPKSVEPFSCHRQLLGGACLHLRLRPIETENLRA